MSSADRKTPGRRENRAAAMQMAYMRDANRDVPLPELLGAFFEIKEQPREFYGFAEELIEGMEAHSEEIDAAISKSAKTGAWTESRASTWRFCGWRSSSFCSALTSRR